MCIEAFLLDGSKASAVMAERHNDLWNGCFLGPLLSGAYPSRVLPQLEPYMQPGDLKSIRQPVDFLGINHYFRAYIQAKPEALIGYEHAAPPSHLPRTSFNWEINPTNFGMFYWSSTTPINALRSTLQKTVPILTTSYLRMEKSMTPIGSHSWRATSKLCKTPENAALISVDISSGRCWIISNGHPVTDRHLV